MRAELKQEGDGVHAGFTMGKIEKALDLVPTGHKADKSTSQDSDQSYEASGPADNKFFKASSSRSYKVIKQISDDFEPERKLAKQRSKDFESGDQDADDGS